MEQSRVEGGRVGLSAHTTKWGNLETHFNNLFSLKLDEDASGWSQTVQPTNEVWVTLELQSFICHNLYSWETTAILVPVCKRGICKWGILKSLVSYFLNFKNWIKLIYDTVDVCNFVINEFNPTFEVQNMGNEAFWNASFGNTLFPNEALGYSCLWAVIYGSDYFYL